MAQIIRAILLARATAASLRGLRSSNCNSQPDADCLPGLATRITDIAPTTSSCRNLSLPALLTRLSQLAVKHPSNGRISGGVVPQGRHHRMDGDYAIGMPSVVILGGGWSGKLILSR